MADTPEVKTLEDAAKETAEAAQAVAAPVEHDVERDTRTEVRKIIDAAEADATKGLDWIKAEIAKL